MDDLYPLLKYVHRTCAVLSISGFLFRFGLMLRGSPVLGRKWIRVAPHVNDTALLAAALALAGLSGQFPFLEGWLTAKVCGLVVYIILGSVALKRGPTAGIRTAAGVGATVAFAYVVSVALTKDVRGFAVLV